MLDKLKIHPQFLTYYKPQSVTLFEFLVCHIIISFNKKALEITGVALVITGILARFGLEPSLSSLLLCISLQTLVLF